MPEEIINPDKQSEPKPELKRCRFCKIGILFSIIGIVILILALAYGFCELKKVKKSLSNITTVEQTTTDKTSTDISSLQKKVTDLQQTAERVQGLASEQDQLRAQLHSAQQNDFEKWHAAEAQYLVKLANDNAQYIHDTNTAYMLLKRADEILQNIQDPNLLEVRKSLATDIANMQVLPQQDITQLYLRLAAINTEIEKLPLRFNPQQTKAKEELPPQETEQLSWWKAGLKNTWQALKQIVIVRNTDNAMPLAFPEEKLFLYQNLHAQMQSAIWGLLHRNGQVYQTSLSWVIEWIQQYYDIEDTAVKNTVENLQALQKVDIQAPAVNFANTLQLFNAYFAQAGLPKKQ